MMLIRRYYATPYTLCHVVSACYVAYVSLMLSHAAMYAAFAAAMLLLMVAAIFAAAFRYASAILHAILLRAMP